jgi:RNA polymerase sigma-70 factor, ECF subfamily
LRLLPTEHRFDGVHNNPFVDRPRHSFDETVLPHLDAAFNLARWLVRGNDAEDVAQEACLRAFRYFGTFRGGNPRAWLLRIVRTTAFSWLHRHRAQQLATEFNEEIHGEESDALDPEALLLQRADSQWVEQAMRDLPVRLREVLMLRELEGLSYKEIANVVGVPIGTVMSTLSRARERFRRAAIDRAGRQDSGRDERRADVVEEDYANCS